MQTSKQLTTKCFRKILAGTKHDTTITQSMRNIYFESLCNKRNNQACHFNPGKVKFYRYQNNHRTYETFNKSTTCGCQCSAVGCLIEDKKSKKGYNSGKKHFELFPLIVWIAFQVNILSNNRDITKYQSFCMTLRLQQYLGFSLKTG